MHSQGDRRYRSMILQSVNERCIIDIWCQSTADNTASHVNFALYIASVIGLKLVSTLGRDTDRY